MTMESLANRLGFAKLHTEQFKRHNSPNQLESGTAFSVDSTEEQDNGSKVPFITSRLKSVEKQQQQIFNVVPLNRAKNPMGPRRRISSSDENLESSLDDSSDLQQIDGSDQLEFVQLNRQSNRKNGGANSHQEPGEWRRKWLRCVARILMVLIVLNLLVYFLPGPQFEAKVTPHKPRPSFQGPLAVNEQLNDAERLFEGQFHAPESMAWRSDKRSFYTGVEGGFILWIEPLEERWTVIARLNARSLVTDQSHGVKLSVSGNQKSLTTSPEHQDKDKFAPFCTRDIDLYGRRAEFEPQLVVLSRCSRPLGIRLAPNDTHLYVSDPLSGLYRVDLAQSSEHQRNQVTKLVDFSQYQQLDGWDVNPAANEAEAEQRVAFADDIAVDWGASGNGLGDLIYLTDCSQRWPLRWLFWLILENDDTGRVLVYDTDSRHLQPLGAGSGSSPPIWPDGRNLSFPNGLELSANKSALLISDLNNRRILMHHLRGPLAGQTNHLLWVPGYSDNIRRGLDQVGGAPTYWAACGCAVDDGYFELAEFSNGTPRIKKLLLKWLHAFGSLTASIGRLTNSRCLIDAGSSMAAAWLKVDPYCRHGLVFQFGEDGSILRALHAPNFSSHYKLLSEAHEVPLTGSGGQNAIMSNGLGLSANAGNNINAPTNASSSSSPSSLLYLGSVYYSYLGRLQLGPLGITSS